jgi:hypothetical protein
LYFPLIFHAILNLIFIGLCTVIELPCFFFADRGSGFVSIAILVILLRKCNKTIRLKTIFTFFMKNVAIIFYFESTRNTSPRLNSYHLVLKKLFFSSLHNIMAVLEWMVQSDQCRHFEFQSIDLNPRLFCEILGKIFFPIFAIFQKDWIWIQRIWTQSLGLFL